MNTLIHTLKKNKKLLLVFIPISLMVILSILNSFSSVSNNTDNSIKPTTFPTIVPSRTVPLPSITPRIYPVRYNEETTKKLLDRVTTPIPLEQSDKDVKNTILATIGYTSAVIQETSTYRIEYIRSADQFMVEIRDINVGKAKQDAKTWFLTKGFSQTAICTMPVVFYLNGQTAQQLKPLNISFSQLADGC